MPRINHVWFDFSDTIASPDRKRHDRLRYSVFAQLRGIDDIAKAQQEFNTLYEKYGSNSNVFAETFGLDGSFWPSQVNEEADKGLYTLLDKNIPQVLASISKLVPISIFSNIEPKKALDSLGIDTSLFTNIFSASGLQHPKPHPEGYYRIVELSDLPAHEILYIGDMEQKDVIPARQVGLQTGIIWNKSGRADYTFHNFQEILDLLEGKYE